MIKKYVLLLVILLVNLTPYAKAVTIGDDTCDFINNEDYSDVFKTSFKNQYHLGPNFNKHDYVFTYSCGGGAICGNIMSSPDNVLTDFPSEFLVDSQEGEFSMDYDVNSNKICFTGKSAFDSEFYNHECYKFLSGKLIKVVVAQ